jgi:NADH-quinone oxidoreductase subunit G
VATERPSALDGGAEMAARYAPGESGGFLRALAAALNGEKGKGPYAKDAAAIAEGLGDVNDPIIVWGERLWRDPGAVPALLEVARALGMADRIGPGLLEVPTEANGRGLREVGCLPSVGPGLATAPEGRDATAIRDELAAEGTGSLLLVNADPVRTHPGTEQWKKALAGSFVAAIAAFDDESTRHANIVLPAETHAEKEGTVTHPDGRLQRLRSNVPHPGEVRPGWQVLRDLAAALGMALDLPSQPAVLAAMAADNPFYEGITNEEIGGTGLRWQERPAGSKWRPGDIGPSAGGPAGAAGEPRQGPRTGDLPPIGDSPPDGPPAGGPPATDLLLGTYRDLWANEITERNPALRFLMPAQRLELAAKDAEALELENGAPVTVSVNGSSVEARVAIRERMRPGAAFLIEGTPEGNGNILADGAPQRISVRKAAAE